MNNIKKEKLSSIFTEEISIIIETEVKDKNIGFITITSADVTPDLSYAKVYFTTLNKDVVLTTKALNRASGYIKNVLSHRIDLRKMPEIEFVFDSSIQYGQKIEKIIEELHEKEI